KAVVMLLAEPLIFRAEAPVRIALRKPAVRGDLVHLFPVAHLVDDGKKVEAVRARLLADLLFRGKQLGREWGECVRGHAFLTKRRIEACGSPTTGNSTTDNSTIFIGQTRFQTTAKVLLAWNCSSARGLRLWRISAHCGQIAYRHRLVRSQPHPHA